MLFQSRGSCDSLARRRIIEVGVGQEVVSTDIRKPFQNLLLPTRINTGVVHRGLLP
jgi:hypothetical protein